MPADPDSQLISMIWGESWHIFKPHNLILTAIMEYIQKNEKRKPFSMAEDPELTKRIENSSVEL
jgi:hypothetical protein